MSAAEPPADAPAIAARLRRLEDERDIRQLMDLVWLLSDAGPTAALAELYTEDCVIDLGRLVTPDADTVIAGIDALRARYSAPGASAREGRSHHFAGGPQAILIDGDEAQAVSYALNSGLVDGVAKIGVTGFNLFQLSRRSGRWRIARRTGRRLGDPDVLDLLRPVVRRALEDLA
jgi:hypothetical protein